MKNIVTVVLVHVALIVGIQAFVDWAHAGPRYSVHHFDEHDNLLCGVTGTPDARVLPDGSLEYRRGDGPSIVAPAGQWTLIELGNPHEFLSPDDWRYKLHVFVHGDECGPDVRIWRKQ